MIERDRERGGRERKREMEGGRKRLRETRSRRGRRIASISERMWALWKLCWDRKREVGNRAGGIAGGADARSAVAVIRTVRPEHIARG